MSRALKPQKVDFVHIPNSNLDINLMLDRNDKIFFFELDGQRVEARTFLELRDKAEERARHYVTLVWIPIISIYLRDPNEEDGFHHNYNHVHDTDAEISFKFDRSYMAQAGAHWRIAKWDVDPEDRIQGSDWMNLPDPLPAFPIARGSGRYLLAYDEATWQGLRELAKKIQQVYDRIFGIVSTEKGQKNLTEIGKISLDHLLPGGEA